MEQKFEELIDSFINTEVGISEFFITEALAADLQRNLLQLDKDQRMKAAGIGNELIQDANQKKRGDRICWIDNDSKDEAERSFLEIIEKFIGYLNDSCYAGINSYEFHYALYEEGTGYKRHVDQFKNNSDRKYSMVNYLNTDWLQTDRRR